MNTDDDVPSQFRSRTSLYAAAAITLCWCAAIGLLAWQTANPVTLNVMQITEADIVVTATVSTENSTTVDVEKEWKRGAKLRSITVENLHETNAQAGQTYIMPLTKRAGEIYQVTPTRAPKQKRSPLVYPANPAALDQLKRWLKENDRA